MRDLIEDILLIFIILLIVCACFMFADILTHRVTTTSGMVEIVSMTDNSAVSGSFILGSGYMQGKPVYTCYERLGDDSLHLINVWAENSYIHQHENEHPYVVITYGHNVGGLTGWTHATWIERYDFHIPENSVVPKFDLDSEI